MRAFVTGATGFIGGALTRALLDRGWQVTALVRRPAAASALEARGATLAPGDVTRPEGLTEAMAGHDVVFHLAAWYDFGARDRDRMKRINVGGTEIVTGAAAAAGVPRIVHCSSVAALGNDPQGRVWDESKQHHGAYGSFYERTKHRAHSRARELVADGLPVVIVMPTAVYGPDDPSLMGLLLRLYARRVLLACPFEHTGVSMVHVDDVADGIMRAAEAPPGAEYILGGDNASVREVLERSRPSTGIRPPLIWIPDRLLRASAVLGPVLGPMMGRHPGMMREAAATMTGSWTFSSARAQTEIGYSFRPIEEGIAQTVRTIRARRASGTSRIRRPGVR